MIYNNKKVKRIPLNIQLFAGEGKDATWADKQDGDEDGLITVPGPDGISYSVPKNVFNKIGTNWDSAADKVKEAKIFISYYLTYGETPDRKSGDFDDQLKAFADSIGIKLPGDNFAHELYDHAIPALVTAANSGKVLDGKTGKSIVKNPNGPGYVSSSSPASTGYSNEYGNPIGKTDDGRLLYQDDDGQVIFSDGTATGDLSHFRDNQGARYTLDDTGNFVNNRGQLLVPLNDTDRFAEPDMSPVESMFNQYYNDFRDYEREGSLGKAVLDNNTTLYEKQAMGAAQMAEASVQAQALAQAQSSQQIVNALKAERNAQLRGGMNEAQLADRELTMLLGASQQLNQQNVMARQGVVEANVARDTAYETAFNDYVTQATALGQNAAANYASQASDVLAQIRELNRMVATGEMTQAEATNKINTLTLNNKQ